MLRVRQAASLALDRKGLNQAETLGFSLPTGSLIPRDPDAATAFPDAPASINTPKMQELRKTDPAQYDKLAAESRKASAEYTRDFAQYDEETIAAVDKFRADHNLNYQGNPTGLVDPRLIDALRTAYFEKKKAGAKGR